MQMPLTASKAILRGFLCALAAFLLTSCSASRSANHKIDQLAALYRQARSEKARREVCLSAIDAGVLRTGTELGAVEKLFGTDFDKQVKVETSGAGYGIVNFVRPVKSADPFDPGLITGWYLVVHYDYSQRVVNYHLSNVHKAPRP